MVQLSDKSAVVLVRSGADPLMALVVQIAQLGLAPATVFKRAGWSKDSVKAFEQRRQVPFRDLERAAQILALDPPQLGREPTAALDADLGFRLREFADSKPRMTPGSVLALAEAAWVVRTQHQLSQLLGEHYPLARPTPDDNYGDWQVPAYKIGFRLAQTTRDRLGKRFDEPIGSMTQLLEVELGIPVVHVELPTTFAGATISTGHVRGIVVNIRGKNSNVWIRRVTMAHELGHYLWDPSDKLRRLVVDEYHDIEGSFSRSNDAVEQRANAFAVEFLAPRDVIAALYRRIAGGAEAIKKIIQTFGIGPMPTVHHLTNHSESVPSDLKLEWLQPSDELRGGEELGVGYFRPDVVPVSRRGRFAILVARAEQAGLISADTAASLLACAPSQVSEALAHIRMLDSKPLG